MEVLGSKGCLEGVVGSSAEAEVKALDFERNGLYASELVEGCCAVWSVSLRECHGNLTLNTD